MISEQLFLRYYPGTSHDGTKAFYGWLRQHLAHHMAVLNVGAGPATKSTMRCIKGEVAHVAGADIDPIVLQNSELDEARLIHNDQLPFESGMFDAALADYVFEHVEHPLPFLKEVHRVLKPGGTFFFRTPNNYHHVSLISRLTPHWLHCRIANPVRGLAHDAHEPWRTFYRLNTVRTIRRVALNVGFSQCELRMVEAEPSYLVFNAVAFRLGVVYERMVNRYECLSGFRANIFGRLVK